MALIYTISYKNELLSFYELKNSSITIHNTGNTFLFSIINKPVWSQNDLGMLKAENKSNDIYSEEINQTFNLHWHTDKELRLILNGKGRFFVPREDLIYIAECGPGDLLTLAPSVIHCFESIGPIVAARFFSENDSHISQFNNIPEKVIEYFKRYGNNICSKV